MSAKHRATSQFFVSGISTPGQAAWVGPADHSDLTLTFVRCSAMDLACIFWLQDARKPYADDARDCAILAVITAVWLSKR